MSLVGTRPILQDELLKYELHHRARIAIKPGITGMWQVSGRSDITDFEEVVRLDTEYISSMVAFIIFFLACVSAYRFQVITTCLVCAVVYYFYEGENKKSFFRRVLLFFLIIVLFISEPVQNLISSFAVSQSGIGYSTLVHCLYIPFYK